ncbi:MAG: EAL domain-containing protein, partial [Leucobacter sp.]
SAIEERRLVVMYQPIVDAVEDRIVSFEALIRPSADELADIPAEVIVQEARRLGLLTELSIHVIDTAVRDLGRFNEIAPELDTVSVNIDVEQVTDPVFQEVMLQARGRCGFGISLELSETSLNRSSADLHRELQRLRSASVKIALDDFGRRSSTLLSLLRYPVDVLKIDRVLISDMHLPKQQEVIRSMAALARNLGVEMIVEGVEDRATCEELARVGVRLMQGHHFGEALSADEMLRRLADHGLCARPEPGSQQHDAPRVRRTRETRAG